MSEWFAVLLKDAWLPSCRSLAANLTYLKTHFLTAALLEILVYRQISWQDLTMGSAVNPTCQQGMM
jgi:hypothetical protein